MPFICSIPRKRGEPRGLGFSCSGSYWPLIEKQVDDMIRENWCLEQDRWLGTRFTEHFHTQNIIVDRNSDVKHKCHQSSKILQL